jgi:serine/threonine protein kinase
MDQIARIHSVVGTPSREVLQQFRANANTQISFSFPPKKPQDLHRLLPDARDATVDLVRRMLEYDPRARITAADAIAHAAFERLRSADEAWQQTAQILPFPVFVNGGAEAVAARPPAEEPRRADPLPPLNPAGQAVVARPLLQDARAKAAQRIREYKMKKLGNPAGKAKFVREARFPLPQG